LTTMVLPNLSNRPSSSGFKFPKNKIAHACNKAHLVVEFCSLWLITSY
jgi:hypothetical protein